MDYSVHIESRTPDATKKRVTADLMFDLLDRLAGSTSVNPVGAFKGRRFTVTINVTADTAAKAANKAARTVTAAATKVGIGAPDIDVIEVLTYKALNRRLKEAT